VSADRVASPFTSHVGSITDRDFVERCLAGADAVIHAATLHKPHVATHTRQEFVDTNVTGTLNLLEEATTAGVGIRVHQHDQRVRAGGDAAAGGTRGVGD
jgi:nucleoside-diphosphate-sugar epimerase